MNLIYEVTVKCINETDNTCIYDCSTTYSKQGTTVTQSEVDDHTKELASNALYMTSLLLFNQIKDNAKNTDLKEVKENK